MKPKLITAKMIIKIKLLERFNGPTPCGDLGCESGALPYLGHDSSQPLFSRQEQANAEGVLMKLNKERKSENITTKKINFEFLTIFITFSPKNILRLIRKSTLFSNGLLIFMLMIKKFSSPKVKIWSEPMFFSGFFYGFERCGSAAFPFWCPRQDLNLRLLAPEASALSTELRRRASEFTTGVAAQ